MAEDADDFTDIDIGPAASRPVPYLDRPLCEPVELRAGARVRIERVRHGAGMAASAPFPHFHDVHELVLFGEVGGRMFADGRSWSLVPGCVVFVPSMRTHDFALQPGPRDWVLVQIDAAGDTLGSGPRPAALNAAICARPDAVQAARLAMLADWALSLRADAPPLRAIIALMVQLATEAPRIQGEPQRRRGDRIDRLRPAIDALRRSPAHAPGAEQAATLCAMSPAWFSRRFKQEVGMSWSDYVRTHRLHLASQRLLDGAGSVAAIAEALGFSSPSHFGELFLRRFGVTPAAWRRGGGARGA